jgi:para-nitrobenzyl esterase
MKYKWLFVVIGLALIGGVWKFWPKDKKAPTGQFTDVISTTTGDVRGFVQDSLNIYLGIPYSTAPVGPRRFKPPEVKPKWKGVFEAYEFGSVCPQVYDPIEISDPNEKMNEEDCLTLNIWSPVGSGTKKAVMVFIHGGGFVEGASKERLYDGATIATNGDVVYVNLNYRLGLLGFLDFSVIGGPKFADSANNGILDQLMALQWVQDNIEKFGGDPQNVTIFGESAGGASVTSLLGIDNPQHYFKRAIIMSGSPLHSKEVSTSIATLIRNETGISTPFLWQFMPTFAITYIQNQVSKAVGSPVSDLLFAPTYSENNVVKRSPIEAASKGKTKGIDLMIGTMANELTYWEFYDTETDHMCDQSISNNLITAIDPTQISKVKELYGIYQENPERAGYPEAEIILNIEDDYVFRIPAIQLAEAQSKNGNTYVYRVDYPVNLPDYPCQNNYSPHGSELPFVFGKVNETSGTDFIGVARNEQDSIIRDRLTNQMMSAWVNFAKTGDPNGYTLPSWSRFSPDTQPVMRFGLNTYSENAPFYKEYLAMVEFAKAFNLFASIK